MIRHDNTGVVRLGRPSFLAAILAALMAAAAVAQQRVPPAPKGEPGPAPSVPPALADLPRLPVSDAAGSSPRPLVVRLRSQDGGSSTCSVVRFRGAGPEAVALPVPGGDRKVTLIALAFDPARRTRDLFYDAGPESRGQILSASRDASGAVSFGFGEMTLGGDEDPTCEAVSASAPIGVSQWHEGDGPNAGSVFARVQIMEEGEKPVWGWCLAEGYGGASTHSAVRNPAGGARQEWSLVSYVPPDGGAIALAFSMSADWTDPRDGKVYRYFQLASGGFAPLTREGKTLFQVPAGAAAPRPIELVVFAEDEWPGCASRAAERKK
jgi:hypothetical protein